MTQSNAPNGPSATRQLELFGGQSPATKRAANPRPASNGTPTSDFAARSIEAIAPTMRGRIFEFIARRGKRGATNEEIAISLAVKESSASARTNELKRMNLIRESGTRQTTSNRPAAVLVAINQGT